MCDKITMKWNEYPDGGGDGQATEHYRGPQSEVQARRRDTGCVRDPRAERGAHGRPRGHGRSAPGPALRLGTRPRSSFDLPGACSPSTFWTLE